MITGVDGAGVDGVGAGVGAGEGDGVGVDEEEGLGVEDGVDEGVEDDDELDEVVPSLPVANRIPTIMKHMSNGTTIARRTSLALGIGLGVDGKKGTRLLLDRNMNNGWITISNHSM